MIWRLVAGGVRQHQVARNWGMGRSSVARVLPSNGPPKVRAAKYQRSTAAPSLTPFEPAADDGDSSRPVESAAQQLVAKRPDIPAPQFPVQTSSRVLVECAVQLPWIGDVIPICAGPLCEPLVIGRPRPTTLENVAFPPEAAKAFAFQKLQPPTVER